MKFEVGRLVATNKIDERMQNDVEFQLFVKISIGKYIRGNWGDTCAEDAELNDQAVKDGDRILAVYNFSETESIWIITEWDRSVTTVLFPDEY